MVSLYQLKRKSRNPNPQYARKKRRYSKPAGRGSSGKMRAGGRNQFLVDNVARPNRAKTGRVARRKRISNGLSGLSYSQTVVKGKKPSRILKSIAPPTIWETFNPKGFTSAFNEQGSNFNRAMGHGTDLNAVFTSALRKLSATGTTLASGFATGQKSFKMLVERMSMATTFTNQAPTSVEFDIYDLQAKITNQGLLSPITEWESGLDDANQGLSSATTIYLPYVLPTSSKKFNIAWKVVGKQTVELAAGRSHEHKFMKSVNIPIDSEYPQNYEMIKGVTCHQLIVIKGGLGDSTNGPSVGTVGFTIAKLISVTRTRYDCRLVSDNPRNYQQVSNLISVLPANMFVQDEGAGAVTDTVVANTYA